MVFFFKDSLPHQNSIKYAFFFLENRAPPSQRSEYSNYKNIYKKQI